jgi:hypothetical protein
LNSFRDLGDFLIVNWTMISQLIPIQILIKELSRLTIMNEFVKNVLA